MGQFDLGTCIILSFQDTGKLKINLNNLEHIAESQISSKKGFNPSNIKSKLRREIEKVAKSYGADLAVIYKQLDSYDFIPGIGYSFSLYKYRNQ